MSKEVRFMHTADIHFGTPFKNFPPDVAARKQQSQREAFAFLVDKAIQDKVQLFLIAGDLFEGHRPPQDLMNFVKTQLQRLNDHKIRTFIIPGNHDPSEEGGLWEQMATWPLEKLYVENNFEALRLDDLDLTVVGIGFDRNLSNRNLLKDFHADLQTERSVLLFHGAWQNFGETNDKNFPFTSDDLPKLPFNYIALGHYHGYKAVMDLPQQKAYYPGDIEGLDFSKSELGQRQAILGTIKSDGIVEITPIAIPSLEVKALALDVGALSLAGLDQQVAALAGSHVLLQLELTGIPSLEVFEHLSKLEQIYRHSFAFFSLSDKTVGIPDSTLAESDTYKGLFYKAMQAKLATSASPETQAVIKQALALGLSAFDDK